jgi:two-component system, chemotaxis family, chemotaxis protein CheV
MAKKEGILLESGTNEVEILEFDLGGQGFGVNVLKIQAIEQYDVSRITKLETGNDSLLGVFLFRGHTVPLVDLGVELGIAHVEDTDAAVAEAAGGIGRENHRIILVLEFNGAQTAFLVDGVNRIHRIGWDDLSPMSPVFQQYSAEFTGSVHIDETEILIVDMEKIVAELIPSTGQGFPAIESCNHPRKSERPEVKIVLAEDSGTIRRMLMNVLEKDGYTQVMDFDNGLSAHERIQEFIKLSQSEGRNLSDYVNVIITDIEMPQMDGLTFCRNVRQKLDGKQLPVLMFSSLINEQMARKCEGVGANGYISKPQFGRLVEMIDTLCLDGGSVESEPLKEADLSDAEAQPSA